MADTKFYGASDQFAQHETPSYTKMNNLLALPQAEFEKRWSTVAGAFSAPTLTKNLVTDAVDVTNVDLMVYGHRITTAGSASATGKADGTWYICCDTAGSFTLQASVPEGSLSLGTVVRANGTLDDPTEDTALLSDYQHLHANKADLDGYDASVGAVKIQSRDVASTAPTNGQAIVWDAANNIWKPGTVTTTFSTEDAQDAVGTILGNTNSFQFVYNDAADTITGNVQVDSTMRITASGVGVTPGLYAAASHQHTEGDITDLDHDAVKIQGTAVSTAKPAANQILVYNDGTGEYEPQDQSSVAEETIRDTVAAFIQESADGAITFTYDDSADTLTPEIDPSVFEIDGSQLTGDVSATQLRGKAVSANTPTEGQVLTFDAAEDQWEPRTLSTSHARAHDLDSSSDHNAASADDYGKYAHANAETGAVEWAALPTASGSTPGLIKTATGTTVNTATATDEAITPDALLDAEALYDNGNSGSTPTVNWANGKMQKITLNAATPAITFSNADGGRKLFLELIQDGTGNRKPSWPASVKWEGGTEPTWSTGAGAIDIVAFWSDGTNQFGQVYGLDFS